VIAAPGNAGIANVARCAAYGDVRQVVSLATRERVDLTIVGPEAPLAAGVADALRAASVPVFGPGADGARLESSKAYAKTFMNRHRIPTAEHATFTALEPALAHLRSVGTPIVVKDSHLAAGKGVTLAYEPDTAERALRSLFERDHAEVVLETLLEGQELSVHVVTDGTHAVTFPLAQDHKQIGEGDTGPMTGGMGAVAPVPLLSEAKLSRLEDEVVAPVLRGLSEDGIDYRGVLFLGVMWTGDGPKLLEINVRFGDPETQTLLPLLDGSLLAMFDAVDRRALHTWTPLWKPSTAAATVVLAAPGYPGAYARNLPLHIPEAREADTYVFHAGTERAGGRLVSSGGRVLAVTALEADIPAAVAKAYREIDRILLPGGIVRRDIGGRLAS